MHLGSSGSTKKTTAALGWASSNPCVSFVLSKLPAHHDSTKLSGVHFFVHEGITYREM